MIIKFTDRDGAIQLNEITDFECGAYGQKFSAYCEEGVIEVSDAYTEATIMTDSGVVIESYTREIRENKRDKRKPPYICAWLRENPAESNGRILG